MKKINELPKGCYLVPAQKDGVAFRSALSAEGTGPRTLELDLVRKALQKSHELVREQVLWEGTLIKCCVLNHRANGDGDYIVLDDNGSPLDSTLVETVAGAEVFVSPDDALDTTEGIWPEQRVSITSDYIEPELERLNSISVHASSKASWSDLLLQTRCLVLGPPGAGKTSLLRRLRSLLHEDLVRDGSRPMPFYLSLRSWTPESDLTEWLFGRLHWLGKQRSGSEILHQGGVVLLLDGLDEIRDDFRVKASESILALGKSAPRARIFLTCRDGAYDGNLSNFTHYLIRPFGWNEQATWISQRFGDSPHAVEFLASLKENVDLHSIAANPLALSIAAALYSRGWCVPTNLSKTVGAVVDAILVQWDSTRGVARTAHPLSDPDKKQAILTELAERSFDALAFSLPHGNLLASILKKLVPVFKPRDSANPRSILKLLREHTGFIGNGGAGTWKWTHASIAEYFAATAFVDSVGSGDSWLTDRLGEDRWQRMWHVACGITHDASKLVRAMVFAKNVNPSRKATLLVKGLGECRMVDPEIYDKSVRFVVRHVENEMKDLKCDKAKSKKSGDDTQEVRIFTKTMRNKTNLAESGFLRSALFYRRKNEGLRQLFDLLESSDVESVRTFFELFGHDGEYIENVHRFDVHCAVSKWLSGPKQKNSRLFSGERPVDSVCGE